MLADVTGLWDGVLQAPEKEEPVQGPFRCTLCGCGLLHACSVLAPSDAWGGLMSQDCGGTGLCKHQKVKSLCKVLFVVRCVGAACAMPAVCLHCLTPGAADVTGLWRHGTLRAPEEEINLQDLRREGHLQALHMHTGLQGVPARKRVQTQSVASGLHRMQPKTALPK